MGDFRRRSLVRTVRRFGVLAAASAALAPSLAGAVIVSQGNVSPVPPSGGGSVSAPFLIGDSAFGSVAISGATPLSVTGGNATVGATATGIGSLTLTGLGSNFTMTGTADLSIANLGTGSATVSNLAQILLGDDLFIGVADGSSGRLEIDGFGTIVDVNDAVIVGQGGVGVIEVIDGARMLGDDVVIGQTATGDGRATIVGPQALWRQSNSMTVGDSGRGVMQAYDGARVETTNVVAGNTATAVGLIDVADAGTVWEVTGFMNLGVSGQLSMSVRDGGRLTQTGAARMATTTGSESHVAVTGASSLWSVGTTITIGEVGFGTLDVAGGGRVTSGNAVLGDNTTGRAEVTVDGAGSTWAITGTLDVSEPGEATLTISNGGLVTTSSVTRVAAAGEIALAGGRLHAGGAGLTNLGLVRGAGRINGAFANSAGGEMRTDAGGALVLGSTLANAGLVDLDGGELEVLGATTNTGDVDARNAVLRFAGGLANNAGGQLAIVGGAVDVHGAVVNALNADVVVGGQAQAVFHDAVTNNGSLYIMPEADVLMLDDLTFSATSLLVLQLGSGAAAADFSPLEVAGSTALAGQLQVQLAGGFAPTLGDSFQLIAAAGGRSGFFNSETLPALGAGLAWDVDYTPTSVDLSVVTNPGAFAADFDGDGNVDAADLANWKNGYGMSSGAAKVNGDADFDGDVDGADFLVWQRELGSGGPAVAAAAAAVPEPTGLALAAGLLFVASRRRPAPRF